MTFDPEAILRHLRLRPRLISEEEKRHGTFNRRMIAASLDMLLITLLVAPLVDFLFYKTYGPSPVSVQEIAARASQETQSGEATRVFLNEMRSTGYFDRWAMNLRWHMFALCVYATLWWHYFAATPGKMICRLKIVDAKTGGPMGDWQSILRVMCYFVSAIPLGLGFFWIAIDKKRRGWHDLLAGTMVIRVQKEVATSIPGSDRPTDSPGPSGAE